MVCKVDSSGWASLVYYGLRATYRYLSPWAFWNQSHPVCTKYLVPCKSPMSRVA
jgi:hypothetical protein